MDAPSGMFSEPWRANVALEASRGYLAAAALVTVRSFLAVPDLVYWKTYVGSRLRTAPGLIGHAVHADPAGRRWCLVTLWKDAAAWEAFSRPVIREGMLEELGPQVEEGRLAAWEVPGAEAPPTLAEAFRRLL